MRQKKLIGNTSKDIRMNIDDIIKFGIIKNVMELLKNAHDKVKINRIVFWHNGDVDKDQMESFIKLKDAILQSEIEVKVTTHKPVHEYVWFDIIPKGSRSKSKFFVSYVDKKNIINGIHEFLNMIDFIENKYTAKPMYRKEK